MPRPSRSLWYLLAALALPAAILALAAYRPAPPDVVEARRIDLVNAKGELRASLAADSVGIVLTLLDAKGRPAASFRFGSEPRLSVVDGAGREAAGLGVPRAHLLVE